MLMERNGANISSRASVNTTSGLRAAILKSSIRRHGTLSADDPIVSADLKNINLAFGTALILNGGLS